MKKKIELLVFWILVAIFIFWTVKNLDKVQENVRYLILLYGYPAVLILSALADALEQPIGPEVPGVFAILVGLNPFLIISLSFLGSAVGSLTSLYVGKRFLTKRIASLCSTDKHFNLCKLFHKYGRALLTIAAISPLPYVTTCWLSGAFNMKLKDFVLFGIFPRFIRLSFILILFFIGFVL